MKKQIFLVAAVLFTAGVITMSGCKKDDTTPPVITLVGSASVTSVLNAAYTDQGATANDNKDGDITSKITSTGWIAADKDLTGTYTITYSVTDAAGNTGTATRTVIVKNDAEAAYAGTYTSAMETDANGPYTYQTAKPFIVTASTTVNNRVIMNRLGDFDNNTVYMMVTGTTLTIPSQTVTNVGSGTASCDVHDRQTDGTGVKTANGFNLTYNDAKVAPCTGTRTGVQAVFVK
jgi:hypothetical protein